VSTESSKATQLTSFIAAQIALTVFIMTTMVFILGFFADPIINIYFDPWSYLMPWSGYRAQHYDYYEDEEPVTWAEHFAKGFAGMGVLGFLKVIVASPFTYFRVGGGRGRATGRDRHEQVSWLIILVGVGTFLAVCVIVAPVAIYTDKRQAIYKAVRVWSRRALERAGERVMDVQGGDDDDDDE
jgi:hypothetical protein